MLLPWNRKLASASFICCISFPNLPFIHHEQQADKRNNLLRGSTLPFQPPESSSFLPIAGAEPASHLNETRLTAEVVGFFGELRNPLLRYVLSMGLQVHDAEEIVQEVFLALFQHLRNGKPRTNLKAWVFRVGHNLALKQRIRNGRRDRIRSQDDAAENILHPQLDPEEQFAEWQRRQQMLAVIKGLSEVDRFCLNLRAEGLRYREISSIVGISLGGVSLALGRALAKLGKADGQNS
jgi:RNA polymerase sigma-70 factor (ECF subfamily)